MQIARDIPLGPGMSDRYRKELWRCWGVKAGRVGLEEIQINGTGLACGNRGGGTRRADELYDEGTDGKASAQWLGLVKSYMVRRGLLPLPKCQAE